MANVSIKEKQNKHQPKVKKTKKVGFIERLATHEPRKSRFFLGGYPDLFMVRRLGLFQAHDRKSKASHHFFWKFMGNVRFRNVYVAAILSFGDLQWGNILITRVYFVEGLGHNLFLVGHFCDSDLEVAFRRNACFVIKLEGVDLLKGDRSTNLYTINLHEMAFTSPICLMARASSTKSWLWHQCLSHLNFDTINDLAKMILSQVFQSSNIIRNIFVLHSPVIIIRTNNDIKFKNQVIKEYFDSVGISHQMSSVRTPQQNGVVEQRNQTSKPGLQSMTSGQISLGLDLTYASSTITTQQPTEGELDLLFEAMYDDYIGGQPSATTRSVPAAQEPQVRQTSTTSTSIADTAPTPTNSSSQATNFPNSSQDVDELSSQHQQDQQQAN
nr:integrase, catalytic region, zinc finger, CCHC-type, peptidase aspartic, catalytic [Tanacetum cinerariifolium]